jgi:hypothetical protein
MALQIIRFPTNFTFTRQGNFLPYNFSGGEGPTRNSALPIVVIFFRKFFAAPNTKTFYTAILSSASAPFSNLEITRAHLARFIQKNFFFFWPRLNCALTRAGKSFRSQMRVGSGKFLTARTADRLCAASRGVGSLEIHYDK